MLTALADADVQFLSRVQPASLATRITDDRDYPAAVLEFTEFSLSNRLQFRESSFGGVGRNRVGLFGRGFFRMIGGKRVRVNFRSAGCWHSLRQIPSPDPKFQFPYQSMPVLIQVRDAHKRYADQVLLDGADLSLTDDKKVGFIGRNGAGKSTLLRVLMGDEELEQGEVIHHPSLRIGYLRQHDPFQAGESALDFLIRDSGQPDWRCGEVAGQFELKGPYLEGPVKELSGGWQTRVKLAALLLHDPNLLMLDEPTNFLDLRTQILLEHFLRNFNKAALIVSHDRGFLGKTCDHTVELSRGKLTMFTGKIDAFLEFREERREHDRRVNATTIAKQKQLQRFIDKNRANASTASQARSKAKQLERLQTVEITVDEPTVHIRAPRVNPRQGTAVRCEQLAIGYPDHVVADAINLEIEHGDRAAIVGDNGQGKTTLLRTLGLLPGPAGRNAEMGTRSRHRDVRAARLHQFG